MRLYELLIKATQHPESAPAALVAAWSSQDALASLTLPDLGIVPMVLNTLKTHANSGIDGGWTALNALRRNAKERYESNLRRHRTTSRGSKADLQQRLETSTASEQQQIDSLAEVAAMYIDLVSIVRPAAIKDERLREAFDKHRRRFGRVTPKLQIVGGTRK